MSDWLHPSLLLFAGAALLPLLGGRLRQVWMLVVPAFFLFSIMVLEPGEYGAHTFMGLDLVMLRMDALSQVFSLIFAIITLIGAIYALHLDDRTQHVAAFVYAGSAAGAVLAGDLLTLYVFWEIMVFASVWLIWCRRSDRSLAAGFRYLIVHALGGVVLLAGIVLLQLETGSIRFDQLSPQGPAFYLILIGFMVNAAIPPLHSWLADAYPESTVTGGIFLSALTTKTAVYCLLRGYPGTELLVWLGVVMTLWGVTYAVLANDIRRILAYHIISQVGFMVTGIGMGTIMALNGSTSHAFTHILYKALLFMGTGAIIHMTGKSRLTDLGGLYRAMPHTFILYMIGALSISAFPLFSGFVSKTMVVEAAALEQRPVVWLLLAFAGVGTFLSLGLKLPWFAFFSKDSGLRPTEAPVNMRIAMTVAALLCFLIGIYPQALYVILPHPVDYNAYTAGHLLWELQLLLFAGVAFFMLLKYTGGKNVITLDLDWLYRRALPAAATFCLRQGGRVWNGAMLLLQERLRLSVDTLSHHHGPQGKLARTWPTGSMVFWVAVLLAASLLIYYF